MKKRRSTGVMPIGLPSEEVYRRVVTQTLIRSQPWIEPDRYQLLLGLVRGRNWPRLLKVVDSFPLADAEGVERFYVWNQFVALIKKYPFTEEESKGFDPEMAAWKKFLAAEHSCKRINQRFRAMRRHGYRYVSYLGHMREYIYKVLGDAPNLVPMYDLCDFGPGASVKVGGNLTNWARKFLASSWTVSPSALSYAIPSLWQHDQVRALLTGSDLGPYSYNHFRDCVLKKVAKVSHNKISFVPKSFKTLRSIATEPLLNGYLQKGIDIIMRRRLKAIAGIDLGDRSFNQEMARLGSLGGSNPYCTIDLSSASDSMSIELVRDLLPYDWFDLLDRTRSHRYEYRGASKRYHKFVSMGDGFCFPLQTLIFASVCHAVSVVNGSPLDFRVYGDDIVARQSDALVVLELLRFLGFRNNPDKTYIHGSFRESCGADWIGGLDVRPAYLNFRFTTNVDLFKFHNVTLRGPLPFVLFDDVRELLRSLCPKNVLFVRPFHGNPESAFTVDKGVCMTSKFVHWDKSTWAWRWKEVLTRPLRDKLWGTDPDVCNRLEYVAVLRGSKASNPLSIRRKTKASVRSCSYWGDLGSEPKVPEEPAPGVSPAL